jgi:uncharacterized protein YjbI with pentapeptide repeats
MANDGHFAQLKSGGVASWNAWRDENPNILAPALSQVNLSGATLRYANLSGADLSNAFLNRANLGNANLSGTDLGGTDLSEAILREANLSGAGLKEAKLRGANLSGADLSGADLCEGDLSEANLCEANLRGGKLRGANLIRANLGVANLNGADLSEANLRGADLRGANLDGADLSRADLSRAELFRANLNEAWLLQAAMVDTNLSGADLTSCRIYGISAWNLKLDGTKQQNLVITHQYEPEITVDNIEVAQFIYLLLHNEKIRHVIDTITSKVVLILGRFTPQRKAVLDALREELRRRDYLPILFDFDKPASRDITETISLLARMARFVLADITDAKSIPQELNVIVPDLPSVPVQPLLLKGSREYGMFEHYTRYPWVLPLHRYETQDQLIAEFGKQVIGPVERMAFELRAGTK